MEDLWWMAWNTMLAVVPFVLSLVLFDDKRKITIFWLIGFGIYFVFLPNAPYILTDVMHLYKASTQAFSHIDIVILVFKYLIFLLLGSWLFCFSYAQFENFALKRFKWMQLPLQITTFLILSIGVYLGRFVRLNSWNIVTRPIRVVESIPHLITVHAAMYIVFFTLLLYLIYLFYEQFNLHPKNKK